MKAQFYISIIFLFSFAHLNAQEINNLVPNGGFEEVDSCPSIRASILTTKYWGGIVPDYMCSSDYFHLCDTSSWGNVENVRNKIENSCAAIGIEFHNEYREYIQVKLVEELQKDSLYKIEVKLQCMYFPYMGGAADRFGVLLSKQKVQHSSLTVITHITPQMVSKSGQIFSDTAHWTRLNFLYTASGGETYLSLGFFSPDSLLSTVLFKPEFGTQFNGAYYLIDEVKLYKASDTIVHNVPPEMPNVFSPNQDGVNDVYAIKNLPENSTLEIFNRWGSPVFTASPYQNNWPGNAPDGSPLAEGVYFAILSYRDKNGKLQQAKQTVHLVR